MLVTLGMVSVIGIGVASVASSFFDSKGSITSIMNLIWKRCDISVEAKEKSKPKEGDRNRLYPKFIKILWKKEKGQVSRALYYSIPIGMDKFDIINKMDKIRDGLGTEIIFDWVVEDRKELYEKHKIKNPDFCITILSGFLPKRVNLNFNLLKEMIKHDYDQLIIPIGHSRAGFETINLSSESSHSMIVAGTSGSGKSTLLRVILLALHLGYTKEEVNLWLMDLKEGVEFDVVENSYLVKEKVSSPWKAGEFLVKLLRYTQNKYQIIKNAKCTDIGQFNKRFPKQRLIRDVLFIDEYAMLDAGASDDSDEKKYFNKCKMIAKQIVQIGRAAGVHTILSTQRPSHEVIDGTMKNNFAVTVGFRVKNAQSSGVVMDDMQNKSLMYIDPEKPGRCIMRGAKRDLMLQIPFIDSEYARTLLSTYQLPPEGEIIDCENNIELIKSTDSRQYENEKEKKINKRTIGTNTKPRTQQKNRVCKRKINI